MIFQMFLAGKQEYVVHVVQYVHIFQILEAISNVKKFFFNLTTSRNDLKV